MFDILLRHTQLEAGIGSCVLQSRQQLTYLQPTWLTHTMQFIQEQDLTVEITSPWVPPLSRDGDKYIMDVLTNAELSSGELKRIKAGSLYLHVYAI